MTIPMQWLVSQVHRRLTGQVMFPLVRRPHWAALSLIVCGPIAAGLFWATAPVAAQPVTGLTKIADGVVVDGDPVAGWSHRVLLARPRVASGDTDAVSETVKKHAELLSYVLVAQVEQVKNQNPPRHVLREVGVGLATEIDGRLRVVTGPVAPDQQPLRSVHLGFIANRVVTAAQQSLDDMRVVVRRTTLVVFDSPGVIHLNGSNRYAVVRSMIWVEPLNGKLHHALWVIGKGGRRAWEPALDHGVYLPVPFEEDRVLHVDGQQFRFGIPNATAFGLASLPPGYPFSLDGALGELACRETYDEDALSALATGLIAALRRSGDP